MKKQEIKRRKRVMPAQPGQNYPLPQEQARVGFDSVSPDPNDQAVYQLQHENQAPQENQEQDRFHGPPPVDFTTHHPPPLRHPHPDASPPYQPPSATLPSRKRSFSQAEHESEQARNEQQHEQQQQVARQAEERILTLAQQASLEAAIDPNLERMNSNTSSNVGEKEAQIRALKERMARRQAEMEADMQMLEQLQG